MDNSIVNVALCNLVLLDAALGSRVTDILPPALWPPLGPCVTNIDAPWTCLTKVNAGKISKLLPHLEMLMSAVVFSKSGLENGECIMYTLHTLNSHTIELLHKFRIVTNHATADLNVSIQHNLKEFETEIHVVSQFL